MAMLTRTAVLIDPVVQPLKPWPSSAGTIGKVLGLEYLNHGVGMVRALRIIPIAPADEGQGRMVKSQDRSGQPPLRLLPGSLEGIDSCILHVDIPGFEILFDQVETVTETVVGLA